MTLSMPFSVAYAFNFLLCNPVSTSVAQGPDASTEDEWGEKHRLLVGVVLGRCRKLIGKCVTLACDLWSD